MGMASSRAGKSFVGLDSQLNCGADHAQFDIFATLQLGESLIGDPAVSACSQRLLSYRSFFSQRFKRVFSISEILIFKSPFSIPSYSGFDSQF